MPEYKPNEYESHLLIALHNAMKRIAELESELKAEQERLKKVEEYVDVIRAWSEDKLGGSYNTRTVINAAYKALEILQVNNCEAKKGQRSKAPALPGVA